MSSNHTNQPSSRPSTRSSHAIVADQTALPVSFTLFLYAGLAGLLLTFVICIVRVFIRHFYLCNFKPNYNGAESSIEIIREASIEVCDLDTHHATVVRRLSVNSETYIESVKGLDCTSIDENVPSTRCCSRSASALSIDSSPLAIADRNSVLSNTLDPESGTNNVRGCCLFSRSSPPVSNGYPVTGPTASVMNVMESVSEFPNFGRNFNMFSSRTLVDTNSSRLMRLQTEERILSFILSNSIRSSNLRDHEAENRTVPGPGPGPGPSAEISNTNTNTNTARNTD